MAEFTNSAVQTVSANGNVLFTDEPVSGTKCIQHRDGSGLITLRGITNSCYAQFKLEFSGNVAIPTGGAVSAISLAIAISGEPIASTTMIVTPAATGDYWNVSAPVYIKVPRGCCMTVAVENTSTQAINVQNANITVERVA